MEHPKFGNLKINPELVKKRNITRFFDSADHELSKNSNFDSIQNFKHINLPLLVNFIKDQYESPILCK